MSEEEFEKGKDWAAPEATSPAPQNTESRTQVAPFATMGNEDGGDAKPTPVIVTGVVPAGSDEDVERAIHLKSRRSFLWSAVGLTAGYAGWRWLNAQKTDNSTIWPLRRILEVNEGLARDYYKTSRPVPTFARALARTPRENGEYGLSEDLDADAWRLRVYGLMDADNPGSSKKMVLTLADIQKLPRVEMVTELKCIEGWSVIVQWAGARFADFIEKYPPLPDDGGHAPEYVSLETPDGEYYVGLDMQSAIHPQTLLCYEMNGQLLTPEHGAPLRLAIPVKYGIKNIKRIGNIRFSNQRPRDYWAEQGYDWYAGH